MVPLLLKIFENLQRASTIHISIRLLLDDGPAHFYFNLLFRFSIAIAAFQIADCILEMKFLYTMLTGNQPLLVFNLSLRNNAGIF